MSDRSNRPVRLAVHRNNLLQKKRKAIRKSLLRVAGALGQDPDIAGFAVISWDSQLSASAIWASDTVPTALMPEFCKRTIERMTALGDFVNLLGGDEDGQ